MVVDERIFVSIMVSGRFACFTRPETRVEPCSYEAITPTAAKGIFESIFWKPEIKYMVQRISVLRPIQFTNVKRNEVRSLINAKRPYINTSEKKNRQQRNYYVLVDVSYIIDAEILVRNDVNTFGSRRKYDEMVRRRIDEGQFFKSPCLGLREFVADVEPVETRSKPIHDTRPLGQMVHSIDYPKNGAPVVKYFRAMMDRGVISVPDAGF